MANYYIPYKKSGGIIVDDDFTNPIHCFNWWKDKDGYANTDITYAPYKTRRIIMHRWLLGFPEEVDHINGKRNDNRISNLRSVTRRQNLGNKPEHRNGKLVGTSKLSNGKYGVWIKVNNKSINLGTYETEIEAHLAYVMYKRGI